ncbi:MAG: tetratricopeptide repeat protein, partial [Polyangiales bacterium]
AQRGMGDEEGALSHLESAFRLDLTNVEVLCDLARLYQHRRDFAKAQKTFRALLLQRFDAKSKLSKADVYFHLGEISAEQGDARKARSMFERAASEDPQHPHAKARADALVPQRSSRV